MNVSKPIMAARLDLKACQWGEPIYRDLLESTGDVVWLSPGCRCNRYTFRGVPGRVVDVLIDDITQGNHEYLDRYVWIATVHTKRGRYDGRERDRVTVRLIQRHHTVTTADGRVTRIDELPGAVITTGETILRTLRLRFEVPASGGRLLWEKEYSQLRSALHDYDPCRIVMWHWSRYFRHLDHDTAVQVAELWAAGEFAAHKEEWTLAEANRSASRALYRTSRDEGWRKLTLRERMKLGLAGTGQWHRADGVATRSGTETGCGQYTIEAASGKS